jgi:serine/threonine-protein kinase
MVRILTQDCDSVATRKPDLPPAVAAIVDACLKRERDARTSNSGTLANQMEGALREARAVRFRALGRRSVDRNTPGANGGEIPRRASDFEGGGGDAPLVTTPPQQIGPLKLTQRNLMLLAAGIGVAIGALTLLLVLAVLNRAR